jgi:hypothetical protein
LGAVTSQLAAEFLVPLESGRLRTGEIYQLFKGDRNADPDKKCDNEMVSSGCGYVVYVVSCILGELIYEKTILSGDSTLNQIDILKLIGRPSQKAI